MSDPQPHIFNVAFEVFRNVLPARTVAVNVYQRQAGPVLELLYAFHDTHADAERCLDHAQTECVRGVTFARGLNLAPREWLVADAFDNEP